MICAPATLDLAPRLQDIFPEINEALRISDLYDSPIGAFDPALLYISTETDKQDFALFSDYGTVPVADTMNNRVFKSRPALDRRTPFSINNEEKTAVSQQWEGLVECVSRDKIRASLSDITYFARDRHIVSIPKDRFKLSELHLLRPGCVFYWTIGYKTVDNTRKIYSDFRPRRVPFVTKATTKNYDEKE